MDRLSTAPLVARAASRLGAVALCLCAALPGGAAAQQQAGPGPLAAEQAPSPGAGGEVPLDIECPDDWTYDYARRVLVCDRLLIVRGDATLRAAHGEADRGRGLLRLSGGVLGFQGRRVFYSESALMNLDSRSGDLGDAVIFLKEQTPGPALARDSAISGGPGPLRAAGRNSLTLHATRVLEPRPGLLLAEGVRMTPCDCVGDPDYELTSRHVEIEGNRARLASPHLRLFGLGIPLGVPISLPLDSRQSGLLFPSFQFAPVSGFAFEVPLFFTLGRSLDLTVSPGYATGSSGHANPDGTRAVNEALRTARGPRLGLEVRYAPVAGTRGDIDLQLLKDLDARYSPGSPTPVGTETEPRFAGERGVAPGRGFGGLRGILHVTHRTENGDWTGAAQASVASDAMIVRDTEPGPLERQAREFRSDVGVWRSAGAVSEGFDATLLQDLRIPFPNGNAPDRRLIGAESPSTFQRLPAAFFQLAPSRMGPATFALEASTAHFTPLSRRDAREVQTGMAPTDPGAAFTFDAASGAPLALGEARAVATRFDVAPRLTMHVPELPVDVQFSGGARFDAWLLQDAPGRSSTRTFGFLGASVQAPLERVFGGFLHVFTPSLELRALSPSARTGGPAIGDSEDAGGPVYASAPGAAEQSLQTGTARRSDAGPAPWTGVAATQVAGVPSGRRAYDEFDSAAPGRGAVELTLGAANALWARPGSAAAARIVRFDLQQNVLLRGGGQGARLHEAAVLLGLGLSRFSLTAETRYQWSLRAVTQVGSWGSVRDDRGDDVHFGLSLLRGAAAERLRAGVDELFAAPRSAGALPDLTGAGSLGATWQLPVGRQGLRFSYDLTRWQIGTTSPFLSHGFLLAYDTPCRCAGLVLSAIVPVNTPYPAGPTIKFLLDLKQLGSFSSI